MKKIVPICILFFFAITAFSQWESDVKLSQAVGAANTNEDMGPCIVTGGNTVHAIW